MAPPEPTCANEAAMRQLSFTLPLVVVTLCFAAVAEAAPRPNVAVAPLQTTSAPEHHWIGAAFAESLGGRLLSSGSANVLSQRQWSAGLRERNIAAPTVKGDDDARAVARRLGADQIVIGTYTAAWPDIRIQVRRLTADGGRALAAADVTGRLADLPALEQKVAAALFTGPLSKAGKGRAAPKSVYAWHALSRCRDALSHQSIGPRARSWLPEALVKNAVTACEEAEQLDKSLVEATAFRALGMHLLGNERQAKSLAKSALKRAKEPGWPQLIAAYTTLRAGDAAGSEKILAAAANKRPGFLHARTTLGESLYARGALVEAQAVFEASLKDAPKQPWVLVQLSKVLAQKGDLEGSLARADEALAIAPDDAVLLMEKGGRFIDGKRYAEAEQILRAAMEKEPGLAAAYLRLGFVYLEQNQLELAGPILQKALFEADLESEGRVRGYAHFDLAKLNARRGEQEKAKDHIKKALAAGLVERDRYEGDADLGPLVKDPALQAILGP